jgi:hypothetical protein
MKKFLSFFIIVILLVLFFWGGIAFLVGKGVQEVSNKTEGSFIEDIGSIAKDVKDDFNKGYNDTTVTE